MNHIYSCARLPDDPQLLKALNEAADRVHGKLRSLELSQLDISDYIRRYLTSNITYLDNYLKSLTYILSWGIIYQGKPYQELTLLDHGGGTGVMSLLARELGVKRVIYNDIYDVSTTDAEAIAVALHLEADEYLTGDLSEVTIESESIDLVVSYDVIEHIYDMPALMRQLSEIVAPGGGFSFSSTANIANPWIRRRRERVQVFRENHDAKALPGRKQRDSLRSYLAMRRDIIAEHAPDLESSEVNDLAKATRGLWRDDIIKAVDQYIDSRQLPDPPQHKTNTCDPANGNWCENLMTQEYLIDISTAAGFSSVVKPGYYNRSKDALKRTAGFIINTLITAAGEFGLTFAPYYLLTGKKQDKRG